MIAVFGVVAALGLILECMMLITGLVKADVTIVFDR